MKNILGTPKRWAFVRNMLIEVVVYAVLLIIYFLAVLRLLGGFLLDLFNNQLIVYAFIGLGLIVTQGIVLESLTSYLIRLLRLDRFD
jgi:hypothetical protein